MNYDFGVTPPPPVGTSPPSGISYLLLFISILSIFQGPSISWSPPAFDNLFNPQFFSTYYLYYWFPNQNPLVKGRLDYPAVTNIPTSQRLNTTEVYSVLMQSPLQVWTTFSCHSVPYSDSEIWTNGDSTVLYLNCLDYMTSLIGTMLEPRSDIFNFHPQPTDQN